MKEFLGEDFLLNTETSKTLFFDAAKDMPIFDYHNHLDAQEIYEDKKFDTITQAWLGGDHYKWRIMRTFGYTHDQITGDETTDFEKFEMWAKTIENLFGNPLYHWTHLELQRYFDIYEPLNSENAKEIYNKCNEMLQDDNFSVRNLLRRMNVYELCTTNTPLEDLKYHELIKKDKDIDFKVSPSFRPDFNFEFAGLNTYVHKYKEITGDSINSYVDFLSIIKKRIDFFVDHDCKITDHSFDGMPFDRDCSLERANQIFEKLNRTFYFTPEDSKVIYGSLMVEVGKMYHEHNLAQQYHIGALRNASSRMHKKYGMDIGCDCIEDWTISDPLVSILDALDSTEQLPKTIFYNLNPRDNDLLVALAGSYQDGKIKGKIQYGSAWWFLDNINGMIRQLDSVANNGMLSTSIGMLTDSRSFLSFPRHEYYRRVLCNYIGEKVENGEFPNDLKCLKEMVENICFNNAKEYLEN